MEREYDVLIIGAGMAGGCLARQLRLQFPDFRIAVIDRKKDFDYWVGESTVEVWVDYAHRVLQLGPYLMKHQLVKQSLRFYFDSEDKDLPIDELSEMGVTGYHNLMSHQLDRATFDRDLCEINRASGVDIFLGTRVLGRRDEKASDFIHLDREDGHRVRTSAGEFKCRYLVDAGGRSSPLAQMLNLSRADERHPVSSYWARFEDCNDIDQLGSDDWRRRAGYALRYLATNHFMYRGYWIWLIPVSDRIMSIGVTFLPEVLPNGCKNGADLESFLREHRCMRQILGDKARRLDFMGLRQLARRADRMFSEDRWFLSGMSAYFADPFLSQGCVLLSYANRMIAELIRTDMANDRARLASQVRHFDAFMRLYYDRLIHAFKYKRFGSFDAAFGFRRAGQLGYWNRAVPTSFEDLKTLVETANEHVEHCDCLSPEETLRTGLSGAVNRLTNEFVEFLDATGTYYAGNRGRYEDTRPPHAISAKSWLPRDLRVEAEHDRGTYRFLFRHYLKRRAELEGTPFREDRFERFFDPDWASGQTLADGMEALRTS